MAVQEALRQALRLGLPATESHEAFPANDDAHVAAGGVIVADATVANAGHVGMPFPPPPLSNNWHLDNRETNKISYLI